MARGAGGSGGRGDNGLIGSVPEGTGTAALSTRALGSPTWRRGTRGGGVAVNTGDRACLAGGAGGD